jgi:PAS domain S-box-containing protein
MPADKQVARIVSVAAGALAAVASVLPPVIYLSLSYEREAGSVEAEAELTSQLITPVVSANPDLWRFEQDRLSDYLGRRPRRGIAESRRVLDLAGRVVAESADPLPWPRVSSSLPLLDAGARAGTIEVARSLRQVVLRAVFFTLLLVPVAFLAFQVLRTVPLRAIRNRERELRRQRDNARRYLDVAAVAVVVVDARGRVTLVNRKGAEVLAREPDDVVGMDWVAEFVDEPARERVASELAAALRSDRVHTLEYAVVRPSGERRTLSWYVTSIAPREGGPPRLLASGLDVTTERKLEDELRHAQRSSTS